LVGQCREGHVQLPAHKLYALHDPRMSCFTQEYLSGEIGAVISTPQMWQDVKKINTYSQSPEYNESV